MKTPSPRLWIFALLAAATVGAASARADTTLRWKFVKGETRHYTMTMTISMKMENQGKPVDFSQVQVIDMSWATKDVDKDGNAQMTQSFDRIKLTINTGNGKIEYDSAQAKNPPGLPDASVAIFRALSENPFEMKMSPRGEISDVKVPPGLVEAMKNAGPMGASLGSVEGLTNMTKQATLVLPEKPIADGDTWTGKKTVDMPFGTMLMDNVYTLEGKTDGVSKIGVAVTLDIRKKEGLPIEVKVKAQDTKGSYGFDNVKGFLKSSELLQKNTLLITANGQEIVQDVESKVSMVSTPATAK